MRGIVGRSVDRAARALGMRSSGTSHDAVFGQIYRENLWGDAESRSGPGSTRQRGDMFAGELMTLLRQLRTRVLVDAACGDGNWIGDVALSLEAYIGVDVVQDLINANTRRAGDNQTFLRRDLTRDALPRADVILCRDCLVHFSFADIRRAFRTFRRSRSEYLLTTTFVAAAANVDIPTGGWRVLNLQASPFFLPPPIAEIDERCSHSGGIYRDKRLALWPIRSLPT